MNSVSPKRRRILLMAEAANPEWVSVPLVGWSLATALADMHDAHIVTQIRNREAFLRAGLEEGKDFTAIDSEALAKPMWAIGQRLKMGEGKGWTMLQAVSALSYPHFERLVWKRFADEIRAGKFDVVHRITPLSPTISSPIAAKCAKAGVPFVLGPLNGGVPWPKGFDAERRREREWLSYVRSAYKLLPGRKKTLRSASAVIVGSRHTESEVPPEFREKTHFIPENAIDPKRFNTAFEAEETGPLRACFVGRLVPYKGADMLIEASKPLIEKGELELDLIGDGPIMEQLVNSASSCGGKVRFHGWKAHEDVQAVLGQCHVMAFPSIREFGGGVVLEAMALGVPPLIVDYAGPGELVKDGLGYKVPLGSRDEIIRSFRAALGDLAKDRAGLAQTGKAAKDHVSRYFTWQRKAEQVSRIYDWIIKGGEKPRLF